MATILIVDDIPSEIALMKAVVTRLGHTALTAENGKIGVQLAQQHQPDLILLLDIVMPDQDGFVWQPVEIPAGQGWMPSLRRGGGGDRRRLVGGRAVPCLPTRAGATLQDGPAAWRSHGPRSDAIPRDEFFNTLLTRGADQAARDVSAD